MELPEFKEKSEIKILNRCLILITVIIILWAAGIIMYVDKKTDPTISSHPLSIIMIDTNTWKIVDPRYTNFFPETMIGSISKNTNALSIKRPTNIIKPMFENREVYNVKDFVIINYFYVEGIIIEKAGDNYTVMYKDHNHVLQCITISKDFLLSPTSRNSISPFSLLID